MKKGFSFIEVLVSVVILSYLGMAILNFNSFNKRVMIDTINKQSLLLVSSPLIYLNKKIDTSKEYILNDIIEFKNLHDDDRKFLKTIKVKGEKIYTDKLFLYNDGKQDKYIEYGNLNIKYKDDISLSFMFLSE